MAGRIDGDLLASPRTMRSAAAASVARSGEGRLLGAGMVALALGMAPSPVVAQQGEAVMQCTNPTSGATWQIRIDYDRRTVDTYPARISDATISWHDDKDSGNYTLDRKSGNLTVVIASSTGGYFLHDHCKPEN